MTAGTAMDVPFIDLAAMTGEVRAAVSDAWRGLLDSNRFIGGEAVDRFESEWAAYCGTTQAIGMANGTDAIQLTLRALGIAEGDEVIVPANSFVATAEAVVLAGATPRFADVDPATLLLNADALTAALTNRTRAVIVVHLYGQMVDMDAIGRVAERAGIAVIEDAAQAHGATWRGRSAGSVGIAGCFSFYPGKNLGAFGDAGAVVTSDAALAARLRSLRDHGRAGGSHYDHAYLGTNSRLDALQAVVLSAKLARLDDWNDAGGRSLRGTARRRHRPRSTSSKRHPTHAGSTTSPSCACRSATESANGWTNAESPPAFITRRPSTGSLRTSIWPTHRCPWPSKQPQKSFRFRCSRT